MYGLDGLQFALQTIVPSAFKAIKSGLQIVREYGDTIAKVIMVECHCAGTRGSSSLIAGQWNLTRRG